MHHQHWDGDLLQIFGEVGLRECDDAVIMRLRATHHALAPPVQDHGLQRFPVGSVEAVEGPRGEVEVKLRSVSGELALQVVKYGFWKATCIGRRLYHQWRHGGENGSFRHA